MKKLLSVLVILCMVSSLLCMPTFAVEEAETDANTVRYEFEDYCTYKSASTGAEVKTSTYASEGTFLRDVLSSQARTITVDVPITEAGYYFIRYVTSDYLTSGASKLDFKLDGTKLGNNYNKKSSVLTEGTVITGWKGYASAFEIRTYEKIQYLDASTHQFTVEAAKKNYYLDYVEFELIPKPLIGEGITRIEPEYYAPSGIRTSSSVPDNGYFIFKTEAPISYEPSFDFDVAVEKPGFYNITYIAGYKAASNISKITLKLGNTVIGTNESTGVEKTAVYNSAYNGSMPMYKYENNKVWLDKGEYILSVDFAETASTETTKTYIFQMDYIEFESVPYESVSSEISTRFEFEDYTNSSLKKPSETSNTPSGGFFVFQNESPISFDPSFKFPVDVEKSGFYDITYLVGQKSASNHSAVTIEIGNKTIGANDNSYKERTQSYNSAYNSAIPMSKYEKEMIWLESGEHVLSVDIAESSNNYLFQMDYIEFAPVKEEVAVSDGVVTATALYENAVSGTPILALYDGDALVVAKVFDAVTNAKKVQLTINTAENFEKAKVFIWNNMTDIKPILGAKVLNK